MAIRCPGCNKFASLSMNDPEVNDLEVDESGAVSATVRIVRTSECCGEEMKEAELALEADVEIGDEHRGEGHALEVKEDAVDPIEEGGGRYQKSYYGATVSFTVACECGKLERDGEMSDKVAASEMDELV